MIAEDHFKIRNAKPIITGGFTPWRRVDKATCEINPISSMISADESRFLYWLAKDYFKGDGCIVDMGPLAGGSTPSLAAGLRDAGYPTNQPLIDSYDKWEFCDDWARLLPGRSFKNFDDISGAFVENLGPLASFSRAHKGDICDAQWSGEPIEILFIDAAKTPDVLTHILQDFYPYLIPGHSIVLHQDFISHDCPWIHIAQEMLRAYFEIVDSPDGGTVAFRLVKNFDPSAIDGNFWGTIDSRQADRLYRDAESRINGWYRLCVKAARVNFYIHRGMLRTAISLLDEIDNDPSWVVDVDRSVGPLRTTIAALIDGTEPSRPLKKRKIGAYLRKLWRPMR